MEHDVATGVSKGSKTLWLALELSLSKWKLAFSDGGPERSRLVTIEARDFDALSQQIERAKRAFKLPTDCLVRSLYEAGRDGFALHRRLIAMGIENIIIDAASIEVSRHARRAKSDAIDAESLLRHLMAFANGRGRLAVVRVPSPQDEAMRQPDREIETLKKEIGQHRKRIQSLLFAEGIAVELKVSLVKELPSLRTADGRALSSELVGRIVREFTRLDIVREQLSVLEKQRKERIESDSAQGKMMRTLCALMGIGPVGSFRMIVEFFGWRTFRNRREVSQAAGLAPSPYASGQMNHEQGISKVGNKRIRALMIELAWCWLRFQPQSDLTRWFHNRFGTGGRSRRVGIVAVARRLLVDLWRYVTTGLVPPGASFKAAITSGARP
jgi:transposase